MPTLEEIRKKKMEAMLQQNMQQQVDEESKVQQQIEQLESIVSHFLTREAFSRYCSLKTVHKEKSIQLIAVLAQAIQNGQIKQKIDDEMLKKILEQITPKQRDIKIKRV